MTKPTDTTERVVPSIRLKLRSGLPATVGLIGADGGEIEAEWYERKPWAMEVAWEVRESVPWAAGSWRVEGVRTYDAAGDISDAYILAASVVLRGPIKPPPLTPQAIAFRMSRGMPLESDPHQGDGLTILFDVG